MNKNLFVCAIIILILFVGSCSPAPTSIPTLNVTSDNIENTSSVQTLSTPTYEPTEGFSPTEHVVTEQELELKNKISEILSRIFYNEPGWHAEIVRIPETFPKFVGISPDDRVLFVGSEKKALYEVNEDGSLSIYASFPGILMEEFEFDPSGRLWFTTNGGSLYYVEDGKAKELIHGGLNRKMAMDSQGNIYAVDFPSQNVQKITPEGDITIVLEDFETWSVAVSSDDRVVSMNLTGRLVEILPDGNLRQIGEGYLSGDGMQFSATGELYTLSVGGLSIIDIDTGVATEVDWYNNKYGNTGDGLAIDSQGNLYSFHPNFPIFKIDLKGQTNYLVYQVKGNTNAMALDPEGNVYLAYGNSLPSGETVIYQVIDQQALREVARVPYGSARALAIDPQGKGYIAVIDLEKGQMIYQFDPVGGEVVQYIEPVCFPSSLAVDPTTSDLWWDCNDLAWKADQNKNTSTSELSPDARNSYLFFGQDGSAYAIVWLGHTGKPEPTPHGLFKLEEDGTWVELVDLRRNDPGITWTIGSICPDNNMYIVTHDDQKMGFENWPGFPNTVFRITDEGQREMVAGNFSQDTFAVHCNANNDLIFTSIDAIFRLVKD